MSDASPLPRLNRVFPPTIVEQLSNTAAFADELAQLRELIAKHKTLAFEVLHITQRMALGMLSLNIGNRRPGWAWLNRLKVIIEDGRFKLTHQAGAFDTNGILRDGQHRLLAVAETGIAVDMPFAFAVPPDAFPAMDVGIRRRGAQFLSRMALRTPILCRRSCACAIGSRRKANCLTTRVFTASAWS